jgi:hypothetical protein
MKRALTIAAKFLFVLATASIHSGVVSYLVFFSSVINMRWPHYLFQAIAFVMLLPFVPFIYIPGALEARLDQWILLFSSLVWGYFYLWLSLRCLRSFRSFLRRPAATPNA